jgi:hypothetical protein
MQGPTRHEIELARDDTGITAGILQQLADAVHKMQATPAIRLSSYHRFDFQHNVGSAAEVDAIAAGIGADARWNAQHTHYEAVCAYSPNVTYTVVYITRAHMKAYEKHWAAFRDEGAAETREDVPEMAGVTA